VHISEGVLPVPVLVAGGVVAVVGTAIGLRRLPPRRVPEAGLLAAFVFVASLIRVPVGGASAHLVLSGLTGLVLGWGAFPVFLVALFLQAVLFSFGGLTTLGVNTANMALPGALCGMLLRRAVASGGRSGSAAAFAVGAGSIVLSALMVAACLWTVDRTFAAALFLAHLPVLVTEGVVCALVAAHLRKVEPELLAQGA